jgi:hypothetical protein
MPFVALSSIAVAIFVIVVFLLIHSANNKVESFENIGNAFFEARSHNDNLFQNTDNALDYDDNPRGKITAINNYNSIGLDSYLLSQIDPNSFYINELQGLVSSDNNISVSYSGGDIVLETDFITRNLYNIIQKFNKDNGKEYIISNVINVRKTEQYYYFNAFFSESKTVNKSTMVKIAMNLQANKVLSLVSTFLPLSTDDPFYKPVSDNSGFFEIKNELGLFYPYATSREDMVISVKIQQAYIQKLKELSEKKGRCFNTVNAINYETNKTCTQAGGIWKNF